jgi:hypothetical protein
MNIYPLMISQKSLAVASCDRNSYACPAFTKPSRRAIYKCCEPINTHEQIGTNKPFVRHEGLPGHQIQQLDDGFLVFRLNLVKHCASFQELFEFSKSLETTK